MENMTATPTLIEKEEVKGLSFPHVEVLTDEKARKARQVALVEATKLGNSEKGKVKIVFEDDKGVKVVNTTIWATTEDNISLKAGVVIPIDRIHSVTPF